MIPTLNPFDQQYLNNLEGIRERMERAQRQMSTGVRVEKVSDDPDQVSTLLSSRASLAGVEQIQSNLGRVTAEVNAGEQALQTAVQLFERARTLGAQGANGTQTAATRAMLAGEVESVLEQMVTLTGTQVEGRFIFSGDTDRQVPYTIDVMQDPPVSAYLGSASTRLVQHPNGTTFRVGRTAQEIFDSADPATNVFASLTALRDALTANDDVAVSDALEALTPVAGYLNTQLAFFGTSQNKLQAATDFGQTLRLQLKTQIGQMEDADITEAILELNQGATLQQAALSSRAQLPRYTLFDYLD